jgi:hypothetical protein
LLSETVTLSNSITSGGIVLETGAGLPDFYFAPPSTIGAASVGWVSAALPIAFYVSKQN